MNFKRINIIYVVIALFTSTCSGILTFKGLLNVYPDNTTEMRIIFICMIIIYIISNVFVWYIWNQFLSFSHRGYFDFLKMVALTIVVLLFVFGTSTIFNIISLSGKIVTEREVHEKLNKLRLYISKKTTHKYSQLESIRKKVEFISFQISDIKIEEAKTGEGFMFNTYDNLESKCNSILSTLDDQERSLYQGVSNKISYQIQKFREDFAMSEVYNAKKRLFKMMINNYKDNSRNIMNIVEKKPLSTYNEKLNIHTKSETKKIPIINSNPMTFQIQFPKGFKVDGEYNKLEKSINTTEELQSIEKVDEISNSNSLETRNPFEKDLYHIALKSSTILEYIEKESGNIETSKLLTSNTIEIIQKAYRDLLSDIQEKILQKQVSSIIELTHFKDIIEFIDMKINKINQMKPHTNLTINRRRESPYKEFLLKTKHLISAVIEEINQIQSEDNNANIIIKEVESDFDRFMLKPIHISIFSPKYMELPMISFACLIDFVMILILGFINILYKINSRQKKSNN